MQLCNVLYPGRARIYFFDPGAGHHIRGTDDGLTPTGRA